MIDPPFIRARTAARDFGSAWARGLFVVTLLTLVCRTGQAREPAASYPEPVQAVLEDHCFRCHGDGLKKGNVRLDASDDSVVGNRDLWYSVLKNVRSGVMPPAGRPRPSAEEVGVLEDWIKRAVFRVDPSNPDPGRVTLRRLNRVEYGNTIRDLMGIEFRPEEDFPPDDTGYGFDTIADVLSVSPLLLEKYMQAAESVVTATVPTVSRVAPERTLAGRLFRTLDGKESGQKLSIYDPATLTYTVDADQPGRRRVIVELQVRGAFEFDPGRCRFSFRLDRQELLNDEFGWEDGKYHRYEFETDWKRGPHKLAFEVKPLTPLDKKRTSVELRVASVRIDGPLEKERWGRPKNFERFFTRDDPGAGPARRDYARDVLRRFATKAYRRPVDEPTLERLTAIAEEVYSTPGKTVEEGVARAIVAVLASPRFLFRVEAVEPGTPAGRFPLVDEYALASRLSYFLWSTMPDEELFRLAERHELRKDLTRQVKRLLDDPRSDRMVRNFTGQWLQARDVEGIAIDARTVLARDSGEEKELKREQDEFRAFLAERAEQTKQAEEAKARGEAPKEQPNFGQMRRSGRFRRLFAPPKVELDNELRQAMRRETEMFFGAIVRNDRSVLDLIDSDFTYLNERLAKHYGIPGVKGESMRKVDLPKDSPRGGLLTQGSVLVVTSNPTRTSPVKRGLFVLDNILGTPAPPPPPDVPQLEEAEKTFKNREPTLREVLEIHRSKALCNSCHSRMDPLGLALENFNALGMWRDKERGQPLDAGGRLITGETFEGIRALKQVLKEKHRSDFYRCLTEKLLTYALGRGLEYDDVETVDRIVARLEQENGRFSALLTGLIESAPFQKRRSDPDSGTVQTGKAP
ncbi:MAG: DUF1592 domain-containing protein [Isosphaeraceae bacterium]|nr:DUF1592 domain-containing protein [Isosphaeraceae bacterium]